MACKRDHERRGITKKGIGAEASPFESAVLPIIAATISQKASMVLTAAPGSRARSTSNSRPPQEFWKSLHRCTPLVSVRSQPVARVGPGRWHRGHAARRLTSSPRRPCRSTRKHGGGHCRRECHQVGHRGRVLLLPRGSTPSSCAPSPAPTLKVDRRRALVAKSVWPEGPRRRGRVRLQQP